jgi:hypothetical protein
MTIEFCSHVCDKLRNLQTSLSSPSVSPFSRIYYPIDVDGFNPDQFNYKVDVIKSNLLRLALTQMKLAWSIGATNPSTYVEFYSQGSQIAISAVMESLGIQKAKFAMPSEFLIRIAEHLEAANPLSPSLVSGVVDYRNFALVGDMIGFLLCNCVSPQGFSQTTDDILKKLRIPFESLIPVREGLIHGSRVVLLMYLNTCEDCFFKLHSSNVHFESHSQASGLQVPCPHGFTFQ